MYDHQTDVVLINIYDLRASKHVYSEYCNILSFVEIERLARWHSAQTRLMFPAVLDTAQRDFVEAQATSGKAPPPSFCWTLREVI